MTEPGCVLRAGPEHVIAMNELRMVVRENILKRVDWLTEQRTLRMITEQGRGWVWDEGGRILGFSVACDEDGSIWALFVEPEAEGRGIGRALMAPAVDYLSAQGHRQAWLDTGRGTRAEAFYLQQGWTPQGITDKGEVHMTLQLASSMASSTP